ASLPAAWAGAASLAFGPGAGADGGFAPWPRAGSPPTKAAASPKMHPTTAVAPMVKLLPRIASISWYSTRMAKVEGAAFEVDGETCPSNAPGGATPPLRGVGLAVF